MEWTALEITAVCIVGGLILLMPIAYNLWGAEYKKEDGCGTETLWDRLFKKKK